MPTSKKPYLNVGCGSSFHPDWHNLDLNPPSPEVTRWNLSQGIPFPSASFEAVYHSHVLEHFPKAQGEALIRDCERILKSGGILRIAIPDLEQIARVYLEKLQKAAHGETKAQHDYDWILLELIDQLVRTVPGGEMESYLSRDVIENRDFVLSRIGSEGQELLESYDKSRSSLVRFKNRFLRRLASKNPAQIWAKIRGEGIRGFLFRLRMTITSGFVLLIGGKKALQAFRIGLFRTGGEIHQWMYDRHSMSRLLEGSGFHDIRLCTHNESRIPDFESFGLDTRAGKARKPDSIYVEAVKR